jgi:transcription antitermination factor NusG
MHWFAITVKPQHEKSVAERLSARSLQSYVPLYRERRRWSDRVQIVELPLFSRYVFCRFSTPDRAKVLGTPSIQSIVGFGGKPAPVGDEEIEALQAMVGSGLPVAPWRYLHLGQRVRICEGPLSGLEGILSQERSRCRVVVNVDLLQSAAAVEIDLHAVRPLDRSAALLSPAIGLARPDWSQVPAGGV